MRNPAPLIFLLFLLIILIYTFFFATGGTVSLHRPSGEASKPCSEGSLNDCSVGNCSGVSVCTSGRWGGCRWETICTPGTKEPCLEQGCAYAYKECDACGTGYGPCEPA